MFTAIAPVCQNKLSMDNRLVYSKQLDTGTVLCKACKEDFTKRAWTIMHNIVQLATLHFAKILFNTSTGHFLKDLVWPIVFVSKFS